jgi:hypothetical protein
MGRSVRAAGARTYHDDRLLRRCSCPRRPSSPALCSPVAPGMRRSPASCSAPLGALRIVAGAAHAYIVAWRWRKRLAWWVAAAAVLTVRTNRAGAEVQCALPARVACSCYRRTTPLATTRETVSVDPSPRRVATCRVWGRTGSTIHAGGRLRVQSVGTRSLGASRPARSSRSATRRASSTFSSVSLEIAVE